MVWASNYSTGVNTLFWLTRKAAEILGPDFDLEVVEMHHRLKKDAPSGTAKSLAYGVSIVPAVLMGVITGCVGGIIRDVIAGRPSILMRPELYVTAAALSATLAAALSGLERAVAWPIAMTAGFALRGLAIRRKLALPAYGRGQRQD